MGFSVQLLTSAAISNKPCPSSHVCNTELLFPVTNRRLLSNVRWGGNWLSLGQYSVPSEALYVHPLVNLLCLHNSLQVEVYFTIWLSFIIVFFTLLQFPYFSHHHITHDPYHFSGVSPLSPILPLLPRSSLPCWTFFFYDQIVSSDYFLSFCLSIFPM